MSDCPGVECALGTQARRLPSGLGCSVTQELQVRSDGRPRRAHGTCRTSARWRAIRPTRWRSRCRKHPPCRPCPGQPAWAFDFV